MAGDRPRRNPDGQLVRSTTSPNGGGQAGRGARYRRGVRRRLRVDRQRTRRRGAAMKYRPELDGLRAIAIILVIGSHARVSGFGDGAPAGVTLFFVLSGYLITSLLVK